MTDEVPAAAARQEPRLLSTVDYGQAVDVFFWKAVEYVARKLDPIYAMVSTGDAPEGIKAVTVDINGRSVPSPVVTISYEIQIDPHDVRNTNIEALHEAVHEAAASKLDQTQDPYHAYLDASLEAVGNNVTFARDSYGWDAVLDALERVEWAEGADGRLHMPQYRTGADVPDLPPMTAEQERRMEQIAALKKEEDVARRRRRRLR